MFVVTKEFEFAASHFLTKYHGKCERLHGHNYTLQVSVKGPMGQNGMVVDFVLLKQLVKDVVLTQIDHHHLNDILDNPTTEHLAAWICQQLSPLSQKLLTYADHGNFPKEIRDLQEGSQAAQIELNDQKICLHKITLWETKTSKVEYFGPQTNE